MSDIEYTPEAEAHGDWLREETFFDRQCHATNTAGERCAYTIHLTGPHTWEQK